MEKKGVIFHKIRNNKQKLKELNDEEKKTEDELKTILKYCVVKNDKAKLKEILSETITIRRKLLQKDDEDFKEFWKFYFIDTDLVKFNRANELQGIIFLFFMYIFIFH